MQDSGTRIIDLSQPLGEGMPCYPGTEPPRFRQESTLPRDGFNELRLNLPSHTGTHLDAPAHILAGAPGVDQLPLQRCIGPGCVIDVRGRAVIEVHDLEPHRALIEQSDHVLLHTGWARRWGGPDYFQGFAVLSEDAARWLTRRGLSGLGLDAVSVDPVQSTNYAVHRLLLGAGLVIVENLTNLDRLPASGFEFLALPLPITAGDGSPVRAVARLAGE